MKTTYKLLFASLLALSVASCNQVNNIIDDFFTFNVVKTIQTPLPAATPTGILFPAIPIPVPLDSATLATNKTNLSKVKTCKLTGLNITFSDPAYTITNFDSLYVNIIGDALPEINLATYGSSKTTMTYSQSDFAAYIKGKNPQFKVGFKCNKAPKTDVQMNSAITLTLTAQPL